MKFFNYILHITFVGVQKTSTKNPYPSTTPPWWQGLFGVPFCERRLMFLHEHFFLQLFLYKLLKSIDMNKKQSINRSNHGTSVNSQHQRQEVPQYANADGEMCATIYDTECRVCELVWEAFKGDIPEGYTVTHIDGDKTNNRLNNLKLERL